ncbi:MAG: hypothetical protein ACC628_23265, partial [Pirellulaceae bacterium]
MIQNNLIVSHGMPNTDVLAISFGTRPFVRNGITGYWGDITISDNMIVYYPGDVNSEFGGIVFAQAFKSNMYVQNVAIRNNQIISHGTVDADKPVAYTYLDGKPIREEPRWREGFGGIYMVSYWQSRSPSSRLLRMSNRSQRQHSGSRRRQQVDAVPTGADAQADGPEGFAPGILRGMAARVDVSGPDRAVGQLDRLPVPVDGWIDREAPLLVGADPGMAAVGAEHRPEPTGTVRP